MREKHMVPQKNTRGSELILRSSLSPVHVGGFPFSGSFPSRVFRGLAVQDAAIRILRYPLHAPPTHRRFTVPPLKPA